VKTRTCGECAELFSLSSSFDDDRQSGSFLIRRNRDRLSTRKSGVGVFTQPGSKADLGATSGVGAKRTSGRPECGWLDAGRHAQSADARKLQRRPAKVEAQYGTEEVDLEAFDPTDGETKIPAK
jgi:hypothetical protein